MNGGGRTDTSISLRREHTAAWSELRAPRPKARPSASTNIACSAIACPKTQSKRGRAPPSIGSHYKDSCARWHGSHISGLLQRFLDRPCHSAACDDEIAERLLRFERYAIEHAGQTGDRQHRGRDHG